MIDKLLIGKTGDNLTWLPLWVHLRDTAGVMRRLLEEWVTDATIENCSIMYQDFCDIAVFCAYVHDIGKATSHFQGRISGSIPLLSDEMMEKGLHIHENTMYREYTPHSYAGQWILQSDRIGICLNSSISCVIGAHHGKPYSGMGLNCSSDLVALYPGSFYGEEGNQEQEARWKEIWYSIVKEALEISGMPSIDVMADLTLNDQIILTGLLIMADWIASNTSLFPLIDINESFDEEDYGDRIANGWAKLHLPQVWQPEVCNMSRHIFQARFGFLPNDVQEAVLKAVDETNEPGIFILEAQMGVGKTEAALGAAEVIASKCHCKGVFFGMPTQATANGLYDRLYEWAFSISEETVSAIRLAHGGAEFNKEYQQQIIRGKSLIDEEDDGFGVYIHPWFQGNKKALLADFVVGTVDQFLMASLRRRHFMLRHLGLSGKVVIIDECHAYDSYMNQYLDQSIEWMAGYGVPVVLLSATLPVKRRKELVERYLVGSSKRKQLSGSGHLKKSAVMGEWTNNIAYPMLTWTDGMNVKQVEIPQKTQNKSIKIGYLNGLDQMVELLKNSLCDGGCASVILNTVKNAQGCYEIVRNAFPDAEVLLYHAQFLMEDRLTKEKLLLKRMGKKSRNQDRYKFILIGTQVLEQSLDYDADIMITEPCPMDLFLQRIGRLQRHDRRNPDQELSRPRRLEKPECHILMELGDKKGKMQYDDGSRSVYGDYLLMRTLHIMPDSIILPRDISPLVQRVYCEDDDCGMAENTKYFTAKNDFLNEIKDKKGRARTFLLSRPQNNIQRILDNEHQGGEKKGKMGVRDITSSIEVIIMKEFGENEIGFVGESRNSRTKVFRFDYLEEEDGIDIARQRIYLPHLFAVKGMMGKTMDELQKRQARLKEWQKNPWLQGEEILLLDSENTTTLCGHRLHYDFEMGLVEEKEEKNE